MDPTQTLLDVLDALDCRDRGNAVTELRDLADWLERGGVCPHWRLTHKLADACDDYRKPSGFAAAIARRHTV